jgi:nucleotide-binding universal stress UspA family protein
VDGARTEDPQPVTEGRRVFSRILAGVDGSERAAEAARQGGRLAAATGAALDLAYVVDTHRAHDEDVEAQAEAALDRAAARLRDTGVQASRRILAGDPAQALIAEAREHGVDLLCVGPDAGVLHGALRFGRTAAHVVGEAPCAVLVARAARDGFPSWIACGVDGSDASVATATLAGSIAVVTGAELHLIHVVPVFRGRDAEWTLEPDEPNPPELEASALALAALGVTPVRDMAMGRPEHALVTVAERDGADLLVVGHRGVRGVTRVLLGSVSRHVTEHARCSVIVARSA